MMVRATLRAAAALFVLTFLTAAANADAAADARKAIQAAYTSENAATAKKDAKGALAAYASDYEQTSSKGTKINMAQIRQLVPQVFAMATTIKDKTTIQKFAMKGSSKAIVTAKRQTEMTMVNPQTQKPAKAAMDAVTEDIWVKGAKGWQIKRSKALSEKQTLDGKPIPGM